jgi:hypothetical protein
MRALNLRQTVRIALQLRRSLREAGKTGKLSKSVDIAAKAVGE